jgi:MFS family permease
MRIPKLTFLSAFATSTCFPGLPQIQKEFKVSAELSILVSSIFLVGLSIGPLLGAPLSEIYGRRIVYQVTYPWFMIFAIGAANAKNIETLLVLRFLGALGGSGALAVGAGMLSQDE